MAVTLGADDLQVFLDPHPDLLLLVSGLQPESGGLYVLLDPYGVRSIQRLALSGYGSDVVAAIWPAELKPQAEYLYGGELASPMIAHARELGWIVEPSPHLAFRNSAPGQRLYLNPMIDAADYARRWEGGDLRWVGQYDRAEVERTLWPWLRGRGYVADADRPELASWLDHQLGNRPAYLRPGLRFNGRYRATRDQLAETIRRDVNVILAAAEEPSLSNSVPAGTTGAVDVAPTRSPSPPSRSSRRQPIPERVRHEVWRRDRGRCVDCGSRERLEFDHIVPISRGGSNTTRNIELRCESCNRRKSARI